MLLVVDIGNTNITLGIFDNDKFVEEFRLASDKDLSTDEYEVLIRSLCKDYVITDCILGSVVDELNLKINLALKNAFNKPVITPSIDVPKYLNKSLPNNNEKYCIGCKKLIEGVRFECMECKNFNYCEACEEKLGEKHGHLFIKYKNY